MNKNIIILICLLLLWTACKKKNGPKAGKQYSTWIVNNHDTFRTNNVDSSIDCNPDNSYCLAILSSNDSSNYYKLVFALNYFPVTGKFNYPSPSTGYSCVVHMHYHNLYYYHVSNKDTIEASLINNKASYNLPPSWFVNYDNPTGDSILVQGTFNLP